MTETLNAPEMQEILKPEQVSPAVAWLSSEACDITGEIIAAGGGYFSRVKLVKSPASCSGARRPDSVHRGIRRAPAGDLRPLGRRALRAHAR